MQTNLESSIEKSFTRIFNFGCGKCLTGWKFKTLPFLSLLYVHLDGKLGNDCRDALEDSIDLIFTLWFWWLQPAVTNIFHEATIRNVQLFLLRPTQRTIFVCQIALLVDYRGRMAKEVPENNCSLVPLTESDVASDKLWALAIAFAFYFSSFSSFLFPFAIAACPEFQERGSHNLEEAIPWNSCGCRGCGDGWGCYNGQVWVWAVE